MGRGRDGEGHIRRGLVLGTVPSVLWRAVLLLAAAIWVAPACLHPAIDHTTPTTGCSHRPTDTRLTDNRLTDNGPPGNGLPDDRPPDDRGAGALTGIPRTGIPRTDRSLTGAPLTDNRLAGTGPLRPSQEPVTFPAPWHGPADAFRAEPGRAYCVARSGSGGDNCVAGPCAGVQALVPTPVSPPSLAELPPLDGPRDPDSARAPPGHPVRALGLHQLQVLRT
ncbi:MULTISPECIES: hypothetical protein [Streptomyces]|uniref:Secreted protein n=1 Tax=Streptomyces demainii TaxID=588122 RepID=A0ABT9KJJ8_9ACTN|nr:MULTISPECIES: hypothetical protein [Streptomyces]MCO8306034.1 hypothetical protein [Streptomyces sp. RKCA744]MDP9608608.1 hypothetical protein [Streptomyces demainii]